MRIKPANRTMLQKKTHMQNIKFLVNMIISNLKKAWNNTVLFQFGLVNSDIRQLP